MALILTLMFTLTAVADSEIIKVNTEESTVSINLDVNDYSEFKVIVKSEKGKYTYNLYSQSEVLPLQMGNGKYTVGVYQKIEGKRYKLFTKKEFVLNTEENKVYLASSQNVTWNNESATTTLAHQLTENLKTDKEKLEAIYSYIINNITYDKSKALSVKTRYNPNAEATLEVGKGICYDYASLTAAMLRSVGIKTKLVKGNSTYTRFYHAWNEVLIDGSWLVVDTTADAAYNAQDINVSYIKNTDDYKADKVY
jgi:transglutaminase-like putative cysteine protease